MKCFSALLSFSFKLIFNQNCGKSADEAPDSIATSSATSPNIILKKFLSQGAFLNDLKLEKPAFDFVL